MSKWIGWILVVLVAFNVAQYLRKHYSLPKSVISYLEKNGCYGYEDLGMDIPIHYLINTEIATNIYLVTKDNPNSMFMAQVIHIDTSPPLLKGTNNKAKIVIMPIEIDKHFSDCWKRSGG